MAWGGMPLFLQSKVTILYAECIIQNPDIIGYRGWIGSWSVRGK